MINRQEVSSICKIVNRGDSNLIITDEDFEILKTDEHLDMFLSYFAKINKKLCFNIELKECNKKFFLNYLKQYLEATGEVIPLYIAKIIDNNVIIQDNLGNTDLHIAVINNNLSLVKTLVQTNPSLLLVENKAGKNSLSIAASEKKYKDILAYLQEEKGKRTDTVLHKAVRAGNLELVIRLCREQPEIIAIKNDNGDTALRIAQATTIEMTNKKNIDDFSRYSNFAKIIEVLLSPHSKTNVTKAMTIELERQKSAKIQKR
jgi:ankyrin repeat protein